VYCWDCKTFYKWDWNALKIPGGHACPAAPAPAPVAQSENGTPKRSPFKAAPKW